MAKRPVKSRVQEVNGLNDLEFIIPAKKHGVLILSLSIWLSSWSIGYQLFSFFSETIFSPAFPLMLFTFWTVIVSWVIWIIIWRLFGKEIISIHRGTLMLKKVALGIGSKKEYVIAEMKNLGLAQRAQNGNEGFQFFIQQISGQHKLKFDFGKKTVTFAYDIEYTEAKYILEKMRERLKMER